MKQQYLALLFGVFLFAACSSSSSPSGSNGGTTGTVSGDVYFQATINGTTLTQVDGANNIINVYTASDDGNWVNEGHELGSFDQHLNPLPNNPIAIVRFMKQFSTYPGLSDYDGLVRLGNMPYASQSKMGDGVAVVYIDANGHTWSTDLGTGNQTGSLFTVVSNDTLVYFGGPPPHFKTKATFNCTLYDSSGASLTVTNGKFGNRTVNYN